MQVFNMKTDSGIYVAGHSGMVGSAIVRQLRENGFTNIITVASTALDLRDTLAVNTFFEQHKPRIVILSAAKVGGIQANINNPGTFLYDNLMIQNNVIHASMKNGTEKFLFLGSSCIYPKESMQPIKEEYLLTGKLEPTNEGYAIAKIAGLKLLEGYRRQYGFSSLSLMPCNLYGPNDSFDLQHSHVLSALVKRFVDAIDDNAEDIVLWGTGNARREFMHVKDLARAVLYMLTHYEGEDFINVGPGEDISIKSLAEKIAALTGFSGNIAWDITKPDGMMRKCMDVGKMKALGFSPAISLDEGLKDMIAIYRKLKHS